MTNSFYIPLIDRTLLAISGDDSRTFLQGLITNDINRLTPEKSIYALILTPQGKFLYDFFITEHEGKILLDCSILKHEEIKKKLSMYKLRSKVTIEDLSLEYQAVALISHHAVENAHTDPRSDKLPFRAIIKKPSDYSQFQKNGFIEGSLSDYEKLRISFCIPSDSDMESDKSFPLEYEMDTHNAIDYKKGCYVGQEVTARTHHRGTLRKKPYIVTADNGVDLEKYKGQEITSQTAKIGILRSAVENTAIALLRIEDLEKAGEIEVDGIKLSAGQ